MDYLIKANENIFDVAIIAYGKPEYAQKLVDENPLLISISNANISGIKVSFDETLKHKLQANTVLTSVINSDVKPSYTVFKKQSIYDLALIFGYGFDRIIEFINLIGVANLDDIDISGHEILITKLNTKTVSFLNLQKMQIATGALSVTAEITVGNKQFQDGNLFDFQDNQQFDFN